jgi:hypothetical protein
LRQKWELLQVTGEGGRRMRRGGCRGEEAASRRMGEVCVWVVELRGGAADAEAAAEAAADGGIAHFGEDIAAAAAVHLLLLLAAAAAAAAVHLLLLLAAAAAAAAAAAPALQAQAQQLDLALRVPTGSSGNCMHAPANTWTPIALTAGRTCALARRTCAIDPPAARAARNTAAAAESGDIVPASASVSVLLY